MADITSQCTIVGAYLDAERPAACHVWDVTVPFGAITAGPDEILLPDLFKTNTRLTDIRTQVITAATAGTSLVMDVESALRAIDGGAISGHANLLAGVDLTTADTTIGATGNTVWQTFGNAVEGTNDRVINLELTIVGGVTTDARFLVETRLTRVEY